MPTNDQDTQAPLPEAPVETGLTDLSAKVDEAMAKVDEMVKTPEEAPVELVAPPKVDTLIDFNDRFAGSTDSVDARREMLMKARVMPEPSKPYERPPRSARQLSAVEEEMAAGRRRVVEAKATGDKLKELQARKKAEAEAKAGSTPVPVDGRHVPSMLQGQVGARTVRE